MSAAAAVPAASQPEPAAKRVKTTELVSGGAQGADVAWARSAAATGCTVKVQSFSGHKMPPHPVKTSVVQLSASDMQAAQKPLTEAARQLGKGAPKSGNYIYNLLARNYSIARSVEAMYAVARLSSLAPLNGAVGVDSGTGWACQLFANLLSSHDGPMPLFVFNTSSSPAQGWYQCHATRNAGMRRLTWQACPLPLHPSTFRTFAGVGSRDLSPDGETAIAQIMKANDD